jgi:hypothetical protein
MGGGAQQVYAWVGTIVVLLLAYGAWGVFTNGDSAAYQSATKEYLQATVISTGGDSHVCTVTVDRGGTSITLSTPALAGACDDNSVLKPSTGVQIEYWNGKATAIYDDTLSWPTVDNPGNKAAVALAALFFGGLIGLLLAAAGAIHFLVSRRGW